MIKIVMETTGTLFKAENRNLFPKAGNFEVLNGIPHAVPIPDTKHQRVATKLSAILYENLERKNQGIVLGTPCNVMLSSWDVVQPDIFFVRKNREGIVGDQIVLGPPDLAVEILSEDTQERDLKEKRKIYADAGIREYWIVDPEAETIEQQVWSELGYISTGVYGKQGILCSAFFPHLKFRISQVFTQ